jgi:hypothetical protein
MVGWLAGEAVPILSQHHRDAARCHDVSNVVHAGALQACSALAGVSHLFEDLEPFSGGVPSQGLELLG